MVSESASLPLLSERREYRTRADGHDGALPVHEGSAKRIENEYEKRRERERKSEAKRSENGTNETMERASMGNDKNEKDRYG